MLCLCIVVLVAAEKTDGSSKDKCPKHLLDFIRSSFIPKEPPKNSNYSGNKMIDCVTKLRRAWIKCKPYAEDSNYSGNKMIDCVTKLRRAGIKCKAYAEDSESMIQYYVTKLHRAVIRCISNPGDSPPKNNSFLDIKFRKHAPHGVIEMPSIKIDDVTTAFLLNCVAYEQCHRTQDKNPYFTTYAACMDCLINTREDVGLLRDGDVIENYLGHDKEVAIFFNKFGKDVTLDVPSCYLSNVFNDVNEYYKNNWHVYWATFRHKYFDSPWSFISLVAAVLLLLLLTFAQTFFAAYGYYQSRNG